MHSEWKGPYQRRLAKRASERGKRMAKARWDKWRAEANNRPEPEPKMERFHRFEFGVRDKLGREPEAWHDLVSVRYATTALGLVLKFV